LTALHEIDVDNWEERQKYALPATFGWLTTMKSLLDALDRRGIIHRPGADIKLMIPMFSDRDWSREEWIYGLMEFQKVPRNYANRVNQADGVMVPNKTVADWFKNAGVSAPFYHCPLGFDPDFAYRDRPDDPHPIRILWLGAFTHRKMWIYALHAFWQAFDPDDKSVELYIKTTSEDKAGRIDILSNAIFDSRQMTRAELKALYYKSHVFLHTCTMEGFGLPPLEAMATGALVVSVAEGGLKTHITPDTACIVPTRPAEMYVREMTNKIDENGDKYGHIEQYLTPCWKPDINKLADILKRVTRNYGDTSKKRKQASEWAHDTLTWDHSAARFTEILTEKSITLNNNGRYQPRKDPEDVWSEQVITILDPEMEDASKWQTPSLT